MPTKNTNITRDQRNHLVERVRTVNRSTYSLGHDDDSEPTKIRQARALIDRYESARRRARQARSDRISEAVNAAYEAINFGTAERALQVVKQLEAKFKV